MEKALLNDILPRKSLQGYVRKYRIFRFVFNKNIIPPPKFHTPHPEHCITFYVRDFQSYSAINNLEIIKYPRCVINGIYNVPIYRHGAHNFWAIKVVLQPTALYHLIGAQVKELTNGYLDGEVIWGNKVRIACEQLFLTDNLNQMIMIIETFLEDIFSKVNTYQHSIDKATQSMLEHEEAVSLTWMADQSCLSNRHFIRKFEERIGISPKMFCRIIRFDKAFRMKNSHPDFDWLYIAIANGYYDYQHMVKEFKDFTGLTPTEFYAFEMKAPERSFGLHES